MSATQAADTASFIRLVQHPVKFRLFLLSKLPSAYFAGVRVRAISEKACTVSVPYKWFSTNPFRSTYFACLAMAAEMSTGALSMAHLYKIKPSVSMLVVGLEAEYFKKATGKTSFVCNDGEAIQQAIATTLQTGEGVTVKATSIGTNEQGEEVARFYITWSFRAKK